ncbi:hypothetical protein [Paenibacillus ginsengarvi]|uniref:DUF3995 domain-containing protein n=1 Tax=Paenibacillus ginsengarvi TaxID=400777 RepID=A0A3B0C7R7_9BACL|nr:hypothetical protein [Paenibacillus ginsengarvi]RKN80661.1 hypothetical protein D7M11_19465 [Paenibacillus ginsengarvi]
MKQAVLAIVLGALAGMIALLGTYVFGTLYNCIRYPGSLYHGIRLSILDLKWWTMGIASIPAVLLTVKLSRSRQRTDAALLSLTSGAAYIAAGLGVHHYMNQILRMAGLWFPTDIHAIMIGYPSAANIWASGLYLTIFIWICLFLGRRYKKK